MLFSMLPIIIVLECFSLITSEGQRYYNYLLFSLNPTEFYSHLLLIDYMARCESNHKNIDLLLLLEKQFVDQLL